MPETPAPFPHAAVLARLDTGDFAGLPAEFVDTPQKREALHALLKASEAVHRAAVSTAQVADALRRDQKFVRPGPPSPHLVRLRQQQAAARRGERIEAAARSFIVAAEWVGASVRAHRATAKELGGIRSGLDRGRLSA
jgi:hypothetical protein